MSSAVLPSHHEILACLIKEGAGFTRMGEPQTLPMGGALFQRGTRRWELLWVMMWPENEFATHWQPFSRVRMDHESCLSLLNRDGSLIANVGTMDPWEIRECRLEEWKGKGARAREGRKFVRECLTRLPSV